MSYTGSEGVFQDDEPAREAHPRVSFFAAGTPRPKGSHKAFVAHTAGGPRAVMAGMGKDEKGWRQTVSARATEAMSAARLQPLEGPIEIVLEFFEQRPKGHFNAKGQVKPSAQPRPTKAPDADKLWRSVGDALNGICWRDDSQVCEATVRKLYTSEAQPFVGVRVTVRPLQGA